MKQKNSDFRKKGHYFFLDQSFIYYIYIYLFNSTNVFSTLGSFTVKLHTDESETRHGFKVYFNSREYIKSVPVWNEILSRVYNVPLKFS